MRRGNFFWGFVIIVAGILLLLNTLQIITFNFWKIFWPLLLILVGAYFLVGPLLFKRDLKEEAVSIPLGDTSLAEIEINHGAGRLEIGSLERAGTLLEGTCVGGVEQRLERRGSQVKIKLRSPETIFFGFPVNSGPGGLHWNLRLSREIPIKLDFKTGASESNIDLSQLKLTELEIQTGASATAVTMPENAGFTRVKIETGLASLNLRIPQGVAAHIRSESGLANISVDTSRFSRKGNGFESPDFANAANKVDIFLQTGLGRVEVN